MILVGYVHNTATDNVTACKRVDVHEYMTLCATATVSDSCVTQRLQSIYLGLYFVCRLFVKLSRHSSGLIIL